MSNDKNLNSLFKCILSSYLAWFGIFCFYAEHYSNSVCLFDVKNSYLLLKKVNCCVVQFFYIPSSRMNYLYEMPILSLVNLKTIISLIKNSAVKVSDFMKKSLGFIYALFM